MAETAIIQCGENFHKGITEGRKGELFFKHIYENQITKKGLTLVDVTGEQTYRDIDVDFIVKKGDDIFKKLEVKIDKRCDGPSYNGKRGPTGNLTYEVVTHDRHGNQKLGWCEKTKADYVIFILGACNYKENYLTLSRIVWIDMAKWREYKDTHPSRLYEMKEQSPKSETDVIKDYRHKLEELKKFGAVLLENTSVAGTKLRLD